MIDQYNRAGMFSPQFTNSYNLGMQSNLTLSPLGLGNIIPGKSRVYH